MNKLRAYTLILFCFTIQFNFSQDFDKSIEKVIKTISTELNNKGKDNFQIAIYPFKDNKDNEDVLAEYVTEEFWDLMPNSAINYEVMDRASFDEYFKEHKLKNEGLIDPATEKQFGMLIAADAYITGKVYVFNSIIRLRVTVTDTQTGKIIATQLGKLPITYDIANYIGLEGWKEKKKEIEKNKSSNPNCDQEKVGDICFQNNTKIRYRITIQDMEGPLSKIYRTITLDPDKYGCFKNLSPFAFYYSVSEEGKYKRIREGNFQVKICESEIIELE